MMPCVHTFHRLERGFTLRLPDAACYPEILLHRIDLSERHACLHHPVRSGIHSRKEYLLPIPHGKFKKTPVVVPCVFQRIADNSPEGEAEMR